MKNPPIIASPSRFGLGRMGGVAGGIGRLLQSNRFVLGGALLLAVGIPELLRPHVATWGLWLSTSPEGHLPTVIGIVAAVVAGHLSLQRLGILPLIKSRSLILPTFILTYGIVALTLLTFGMHPGRYPFWISLVVCLAWYFLVSIGRGRLLRPTIGLIGMGAGFIRSMPVNLSWKIIQHPRDDIACDAVVLDPHLPLDLEWSQFVTGLVLAGTPVYHRTHIAEGLTGKVYFNSHAENHFGALLPSLGYLRLKRYVDFAGAVLALPFVLVVLGVAAILIKLDSPGPVIYRQMRQGYRGRPFCCYKLRTMRTDAVGPSYTLEGDPRVTRLGKFMRKWRVDELPQIFNILKGEMSWIGPRPEAVPLAAKYGANVPFYEYRHAVRPGISGWAAVHQGNVAEVDAAKEKLAYDFFYIKYFSFWLDWLIVLKTAQTILTGFGSR